MVISKDLGGRPPVKIPDEDLDRLGRDLLAWLDKEGKEEIFFKRWYYDRNNFTKDDWHHLTKREGFRPYYDLARTQMTSNLIKGEIEKSYVHRYLGIYDKQLDEHEEAIKDKEAQRKKLDATNMQALAEGFGRMQSFFEQLRSMQTSENTLALVNHKV